MVWNDWFDLEQDFSANGAVPTDRLGPDLEGGRLSRLGVVLMAAGVGFAALADLVRHADRGCRCEFAILLVVAIFVYDEALVKRTMDERDRTWRWGLPIPERAARPVGAGPSRFRRRGYVLLAPAHRRLHRRRDLIRPNGSPHEQADDAAGRGAWPMLGGLFLGLAVPALAIEQAIDVYPAIAFPVPPGDLRHLRGDEGGAGRPRSEAEPGAAGG